MNIMYDVCALGELLIDFTPCGEANSGITTYEANPGGAPANVLVALSRLDGRSAFIGQVGNDQFGVQLRKTLENFNIDVSGLVISECHHTTLAFVHLDSNGDRSFSFCRAAGADCMLEKSKVDTTLIEKSKIFHFGSLSLTNEPVRAATINAIQFAKSAGKIISFDPNYRPTLWDSENAARRQILYGLNGSDIVKLSHEEMILATHTADCAKGTDILLGHGASLAIITLGAEGCFYRSRKAFGHIPTYDTQVIDTTGAGDAFTGALLGCICGHGVNTLDDMERLSRDEVEDFLDFANAAGAVCASKTGAIPAIPAFEEITACRRYIKRKSH